MAKYRFNFLAATGTSYRVLERCYFVTTVGSTTPYQPSGTTFSDEGALYGGTSYSFNEAYEGTGTSLWHSAGDNLISGIVDYGEANDPVLVEAVLKTRNSSPEQGPKEFSIDKWDGTAWVEFVRYSDIPAWTALETRRYAIQMFAVSGTVYDSASAPAARTVRAYRRDTGALLAETTSNATTGEYLFEFAFDGEVQVVCLDDAGGTLENDLIHRTYPV